MNVFRQPLKASLKQASEKARNLGHTTAESLSSGVDRLLDRRICLGVTGFSGSGKTTMITSLIHQLRYYPDAVLAALPPALQDRLLGVRLSHLKGLPFFPYEQGATALSSGRWPKATRQESGCQLEIKYRTRRGIIPGRKPGIGRLFLEIRDYPGEWLLDLPLLAMSYSDWCLQFRKSLDQNTLHAFPERLKALDPTEVITDVELEALWQQQLDYLKVCQQKGMTLIQPGRLLHIQPDSPENQCPFIPLPGLPELTEEQRLNAPENALFKRCEKNYQHYLEQWVEPFYKNTFQKVDRQLVLIDVLKGLNQGQASLDNLRLGLTQVLQSFEYGQNSLIRRLINPRVDRAVFAASKIDQVLPDQHEQVRSLTAALVKEAQRRATFNEIDVRCEAVAAVRSTTHVEYAGQTALKGNTADGPGILRHPPIPEQLPDHEYWQSAEPWQLRRLLPPSGLKLHNGDRLPHIRLDSVLNDLLGDKFL